MKDKIKRKMEELNINEIFLIICICSIAFISIVSGFLLSPIVAIILPGFPTFFYCLGISSSVILFFYYRIKEVIK